MTKTRAFTFYYERIVFLFWISCAQMSELAESLPRKFIQCRHLDVESTTGDLGTRGRECASIPPTEKLSDEVAVIAATNTSPAQTSASLQTISEEPTGDGKEVCEGEFRELYLTTSQEARLLSSGSEDREVDMTAWF